MNNYSSAISSKALSRTVMIKQHLSSSSNDATPVQILEDQVDAPIISEESGPLAILTLNRPSNLNALTLDMNKNAANLIQSWEESAVTKVILIKGKGRAFCAGGDLTTVINSGTRLRSIGEEFFKAEYELDNYVAKLNTPVVAFMDGITMGAGVGLSVHAPFRVATERTVFAMPETTIGLFPDVGASFFLPRLDGYLGLYLGLTSYRLNGWGVLQSGIATHYVPSDQLEAIQDRLSQLEFSSRYSKLDVVNNVLNEFSLDAPIQTSPDQKVGYELVGKTRQAIDSAFSQESVEKIVSSLRQMEESDEDQGIRKWAKQTADTIEFRSPTSCKVTFQAYKRGARMNIDKVFDMEMKLASRFCDAKTTMDFVTGVKHILVDKNRSSRADWKPNTLEEVTRCGIVEKFFESPIDINISSSPLLASEDIKHAYTQYPHYVYRLAPEETIEAVVKGSALTRSEVVEKIFSNGKIKGGLNEKVKEVLNRKTAIVGPEGVLEWCC